MVSINLHITHPHPKKAAQVLNKNDLFYDLLTCLEIFAIWHHYNVNDKQWLCHVPLYLKISRNKHTIMNDPFHDWVEEDLINLRWVFDYSIHILDEWEFRFKEEHEARKLFTSISHSIYPFIKGVDSTNSNIKNYINP
jgi:hypothetical protein